MSNMLPVKPAEECEECTAAAKHKDIDNVYPELFMWAWAIGWGVWLIGKAAVMAWGDLFTPVFGSLLALIGICAGGARLKMGPWWKFHFLMPESGHYDHHCHVNDPLGIDSWRNAKPWRYTQHVLRLGIKFPNRMRIEASNDFWKIKARPVPHHLIIQSSDGGVTTVSPCQLLSLLVIGGYSVDNIVDSYIEAQIQRNKEEELEKKVWYLTAALQATALLSGSDRRFSVGRNVVGGKIHAFVTEQIERSGVPLDDDMRQEAEELAAPLAVNPPKSARVQPPIT